VSYDFRHWEFLRSALAFYSNFKKFGEGWMKVLIIGNGGREHALVWKIAQSPLVKQVFCAPGNPGTAEIAQNVAINVLEFEKLLRFAEESKIDLTVVGPEDPLATGIVDLFRDHDLKIFGPDKKAAQLEGSKDFAKNLMKKYHIPTAAFRSFDAIQPAIDYIRSLKRYPVVLKASGLAAGKGVLICHSVEEALSGINLIMKNKAFGSAGDRMIIEEFLEGDEVSLFAICDGKDYLLLSPSQDHKKVFDADQGKNTGGMGAYAPAPVATNEVIATVRSTIVEPTLSAMTAEGMPYLGLLYIGIILTGEGPKVLEYNCRFGDPETEVVLPLLKSDLIPLLLASVEGRLKKQQVSFNEGFALDVVLTSGGYPDAYEKGKVIKGLKSLEPDILVFHAGTRTENNQLLTCGGRVLNIVATGKNFPDLRQQVYKNIQEIGFEGMHYRRDIGDRALKYLPS
jgi:phosphoribosylamine--glycine ligase